MEVRQPSKTEMLIEGRRLVNVDTFLKNLKIYSQHCEKFGCSLRNLEIVSEKRTGLISKCTIKCNFCNYQNSLSTDDDCASLDVNRSVVSEIVAIGGGQYQLEEFLAADSTS